VEMMKQKAHKENKLEIEAQEIAAKLADVTVSIVTKAGENGKIFGSVNTLQLAEALRKEGFDIDRKSLKIKDEPIKEIGTFEAEANLFRGVKQAFKFEVVSE
jgi:large subunit ribosomal protein L9